MLQFKNNRYRYAGYQLDYETGMYELIARFDNLTHGVLVSLEPNHGGEGDSLIKDE